jgi:hypothetical protein
MADFRNQDAPDWPPELAAYDGAVFKTRLAWRWAQYKAGKGLGFNALELLQAATASTTCRRCNPVGTPQAGLCAACKEETR